MKKLFLLIIASVLRHPSACAAFLVFALGFSAIASNAVFLQTGSHPEPIWKTRDTKVSHTFVVKPVKPDTTNSILTQSTSLNNVPVPTMRPALRMKPAAQSSIVRDVQFALGEIGYYEGKVDGIYGPATRSAIMTYQSNAGMLPDGEASFGLLSNIELALAIIKKEKQTQHTATAEPVKPSPSVPASAPAAVASQKAALVAKIQKGLAEFGYDEVAVDGIMGSQTRQAIRAFQNRFELRVTGEPDADILDKLVQIGILSGS